MEVVEGHATVEDLDGFLDELAAIGDATGCAVQAFDARYVVGHEHLARAVELADRAFERDENVARDRSVEILLYAAGRRQIDRALEMGVSEGESPVVVVVHGTAAGAREREAADRVAGLLEPAATLDVTDAERVREFFGISDGELAATAGGLADAVRERVALLDVEK